MGQNFLSLPISLRLGIQALYFIDITLDEGIRDVLVLDLIVCKLLRQTTAPPKLMA